MSETILVDTDVLIDAAREVAEAIDCLLQLEKSAKLAVNSITQMELLAGCRNKTEMRSAERFLRRFQVVKLTPEISDKAVDLIRQYRLSHGLRMPDALIAATAITLSQPLISKNQGDYRYISELLLLPYPLPKTDLDPTVVDNS